eukprot:gene20137-biopygen6535
MHSACKWCEALAENGECVILVHLGDGAPRLSVIGSVSVISGSSSAKAISFARVNVERDLGSGLGGDGSLKLAHPQPTNTVRSPDQVSLSIYLKKVIVCKRNKAYLCNVHAGMHQED